MYFSFNSVAYFLNLSQDSINFIQAAMAVSNPSGLNGYSDFVTDFERALTEAGFTDSGIGAPTSDTFRSLTSTKPALNTQSPEIVDVANEMFQTHSQLTTLEVKDELRKRNYWVEQNTVSQAMSNWASTGNWSYSDTGRYRVYTSNVVSVTPGVTPVTPTANPMSTLTSTTPVNPVRRPAYGKTKVADWTCFDKNNMNSFRVYTNMTQNQAKYRCSVDLGIAYTNVMPRLA